MDEPTAALGVAETERVEHIIEGLKARNLAILIVSHNRMLEAQTTRVAFRSEATPQRPFG
jgi:ABC-type sugar transport system ATPase subunit